MSQFEKLQLSATNIAAITNSECTTCASSDLSNKDLIIDIDEDSMDVENQEMLHDDERTIGSENSNMTKTEAMQKLIMRHYFMKQVLQKSDRLNKSYIFN